MKAIIMETTVTKGQATYKPDGTGYPTGTAEYDTSEPSTWSSDSSASSVISYTTILPATHSDSTSNGHTWTSFHHPTTVAPSVWKVVSFGLIGAVAVLIIACVILLVILWRQKKKLKQANDTLYTRDAEKSYTPLKPKGKKGPGVELTNIAKMHEEEEIDSPTFSAPPPPPAFPRTASQLSVGKPPELPSRNPKMPEPKSRPKKTKQPPKDKEILVKSTPKDEKFGIDNAAFTKGEESAKVGLSDHVVNAETGLHDDDDDEDMYEKYSHELYLKFKAMNISSGDKVQDTGLENQQAYEVPVETKNKKKTPEEDFIHRQSSSSGLPEMCFTAAETSQTSNISTAAPLHPNPEDIYDNDDVEMRDTGLPSSEPLTLDDLQAYEDVEMSATDESSKANEHDHASKTISTAANKAEIGLYDTGEIGSKVEFDDSDSEPGLYEDCEPDDIVLNPSISSETGNNWGQSKLDSMPINDSSESELDKGTGHPDMQFLTESDSEIPEDKHETKVPSELETIPINDRHSVESNHVGGITGEIQTASGLGSEIQMPDLMLPKVPPRRDLLPKLSISSDSKVEETLEDNNNIEISSDVAMRHVERAPMSNVEDRNLVSPPRQPYFLDMAENSEELSEEHQKRISVHKMVDTEMALQELLKLYGDKPKETLEEENEAKHAELQPTAVETTHSVSNGFLANGGIVDNDDYDDDDENLYDVPPPV